MIRALVRRRWAGASLVACAWLLGRLVARLLAGPTPRHPFANAIVDVAVSAITVTVVWRLTDTAVRRDRIAVGALGVIGFFVLTFGPGHVDAAAAVVPAAWFGAALFAGRA